MTDTKLIQILIDNVAAFRKEMNDKFDKLDKKFDGRIDQLETKLTKRIDDLDSKLTKRIDKIGRQVAFLEDDTPTREEHNLLEKRVEKIEKKIAMV